MALKLGRRAAGVCAGLACAAYAGTLRAGNEDSFLFGDRASLTAGATVASITDTAAIWYNPAALGQNRRGRLELSGTAFTLRWRPIPNGLALDLPSSRLESSIDSKELYVVPTSLAAVREIGDDVSVGVGLFVTEQDLFNFERSLMASDGTVDLDVAGALTGTDIRYNAGPAIGWQATPRLRVGASIFGVYELRHELRKLFVDARIAGAYAATFFQRIVDASVTRIGAELVVGAQLDAGAGWMVGFAARSPRLVFHEGAQTDNSTALISTGPGVPTVTTSTVDHALIGAAGTGFTRPPRFALGAAKRFEPIEVSAEVELRPPAFEAKRFVWNVRVGALWSAGPNTELGAGVFTDRSDAGVPAAFPDSRVDYYGLTAGWKQRNVLRLESGEHAGSLQFSTTIAVRYALGTGESTRIRFDFRDTASSGQVGRIADERVDVTYHELSLYLGTGFEF